jgi:thiamine biosynthesis lipoprotein
LHNFSRRARDARPESGRLPQGACPDLRRRRGGPADWDKSPDNVVMTDQGVTGRAEAHDSLALSATTPLSGLRRVEQIMGTAISLDVRDASVSPAALEEVFGYLRDVDGRFSPYKPDSEVSRLIRGELEETDASSDLRAIMSLCDQVRWTSEGYFDIRAHRPDGRPDPTGMVKGWALENASRMLEAAGARNYCINGGGDIVARGNPAGSSVAVGGAWRVGIRHPFVADRLAAVLTIRDGAVATSGAYERGEHIRDPLTGRAPEGLLSVTIVGPSLTLADAYATAAFAMGSSGLAWVAALSGFAGCGVTTDQDGSNARLVWTPGFERYFADGPTAQEGGTVGRAHALAELPEEGPESQEGLIGDREQIPHQK